MQIFVLRLEICSNSTIFSSFWQEAAILDHIDILLRCLFISGKIKAMNYKDMRPFDYVTVYMLVYTKMNYRKG